ncbi:hypothetical protein SpCBS45565_g00009 [Spizellomyces sp. 'palustris']|nr:hypothetical protein SpCBS45565_g00009 [Spizellomyces sp. 'palustris']
MGQGGRGGKTKPKRGGGKRFTPARVLREEGDVWNQKPEKEGSEASSDEESSSEDEIQQQPKQQQKPVPAIPANSKLGNTEEHHAGEGSDDQKDITNPNRNVKSHLKASDLGGERELSRREREAIAKERAKAAFWKAQMEGKTEQARADLARLAIIKKQREEAAKKRTEELAAKGKGSSSKVESLNAGKGIISKSLGKKN